MKYLKQNESINFIWYLNIVIEQFWMNLNHIGMGKREILDRFCVIFDLFSVPEMMIKKITYQVLNAVDFCHRHNVRLKII